MKVYAYIMKTLLFEKIPQLLEVRAITSNFKAVETTTLRQISCQRLEIKDTFLILLDSSSIAYSKNIAFFMRSGFRGSFGDRVGKTNNILLPSGQ